MTLSKIVNFSNCSSTLDNRSQKHSGVDVCTIPGSRDTSSRTQAARKRHAQGLYTQPQSLSLLRSLPKLTFFTSKQTDTFPKPTHEHRHNSPTSPVPRPWFGRIPHGPPEHARSHPSLDYFLLIHHYKHIQATSGGERPSLCAEPVLPIQRAPGREPVPHHRGPLHTHVHNSRSPSPRL